LEVNREPVDGWRRVISGYRLYLGVLSIAAIAAVAWRLAQLSDPVDGWIAAGLALTAALSLVAPFRLRTRTGHGMVITLEGTVLVAMAWNLPSEIVPLAMFAATFAGEVLSRVPATKATFNAASLGLAAAAGMAPFDLLEPTGSLLSLRGVGATVLLVAVYGIVTLLTILELFRRLEGRRYRDSLHTLGALLVLDQAVSVLFGLLLALAVASEPAAAFLGTAVVAALAVGARGYGATIQQRQRGAPLHDLAALLAEPQAEAPLLSALVEGVARTFDAGQARVVVADEVVAGWGDGGAPPVSEAEAEVVTGAPTAVRRDDAGGEIDEIAVAFGTGDGRRAALSVGERHGVTEWTERDVTLLSALASQAATALRNRTLLEQVDRERARLAEESDKLAEIIDGSSDGIVLLDLAGRIRTWNPAMERATGVSTNAATDQPWHEVLRTEADGLSMPPRPLVLATDAARDGVRIDRPVDVEVNSGAGPRWLRCSLAPVERADEGVVGVVIVARDVTAEREVDGMKADFVAVVSHELRTPLTPLKGFLDTVLQRWESLDREQLHTILGSMGRQVTRLETLVGDLLTVADLDRGEVAISRTACDLTEIARTAASVEDRRGDRVEVEVNADHTQVETDRSALLRVVRVLVGNAVKHTEGPVTVTVDEADGLGRITVADQGGGIAPWDQERIFEPFVRVGDHLSWSTQGPGLGLAIARSLCDTLGAELSLESTPGEGSRFSISCPSVGAARTS
jgi:PAS domain S-box-containing protein